MGNFLSRRNEENSAALAKDGFDAPEPLPKDTVWYRGERQSATSAEHEDLSRIGSLALSQPTEDLKTLEPEHKIYRKPIPSLETYTAVQGASQTMNASAMPPRHPDDLGERGASRLKGTSSRGKRRKHGDQSTGSSSPQISNASLTRSHQSYRPSLWAWIDHIPQSADDATIIFNVQQVFTLAEQYVNNFYVDRQHSQQCQREHFLRHESFENLPVGIQPSDVVHIVAQPTVMIKHSLVALLLSTISLTQNGPYCLLPSEFTALARAVSSGRGCAAEIDHFDAAFASHRVLLSYLFPAMADNSSYVKAHDDIMDNIITHFEYTFRSWLDEKEPDELRLPNFVTLLQHTANLGILLFSQPSMFEFNWRILDPSPSGIDIPIAPRMLKISDENARELRPSQHMVRIKRLSTQQIASPPQKLHGESTISGQSNFNRQAPTKKSVFGNRPLTASHVDQRDADQLDHQGHEMVHELSGDMNQHFDSSVHELPVSPPANSSPQRGHGEARNSHRHIYDRGAADAESYGRPGESTDNARTAGQARQGQSMAMDTKARTQQTCGPSSFPTGQGSHPRRSGSMDGWRSGGESQRDRRRSRSASGARRARSSTRDNLYPTPGNESRFLDTEPASVVDQHGKMRPGSARTHEHGAPVAPKLLPSGSFDYADEAGPATHQAIGRDQAHNGRTESWQPREQDLQSSLDNRPLPEVGQAQSPPQTHRLRDSMRKSSESSKPRRKLVAKAKAWAGWVAD